MTLWIVDKLAWSDDGLILAFAHLLVDNGVQDHSVGRIDHDFKHCLSFTIRDEVVAVALARKDTLGSVDCHKNIVDQCTTIDHELDLKFAMFNWYNLLDVDVRL